MQLNLGISRRCGTLQKLSRDVVVEFQVKCNLATCGSLASRSPMTESLVITYATVMHTAASQVHREIEGYRKVAMLRSTYWIRCKGRHSPYMLFSVALVMASTLDRSILNDAR